MRDKTEKKSGLTNAGRNKTWIVQGTKAGKMSCDKLPSTKNALVRKRDKINVIEWFPLIDDKLLQFSYLDEESNYEKHDFIY